MTTRAYRIALMLYATAKKKGYTRDTYGCAEVRYSEMSGHVAFQDPDIMTLRSAGILTLTFEGVILDKNLLGLPPVDLQVSLKSKLHML